jgi:hypothetical protein
MLTESDVTGRQLPDLRRRRAGTAYYGERRKQDAEILRLSENGSGLLGERGVWKLISGGGWAAGDWVNRRNPDGRLSVQVSLVSLEHCSLVCFIYSALESWLNRSRIPEAEKIRRVI